MIEYLVQELVDKPQSVAITESVLDDVVTYQIHVARFDVGKVIGAQGNIIKALRTIVKAVAMKTKEKVNLEIDS